jgi:hypothetical protein
VESDMVGRLAHAFLGVTNTQFGKTCSAVNTICR